MFWIFITIYTESVFVKLTKKGLIIQCYYTGGVDF